jgi:hypothetical protein
MCSLIAKRCMCLISIIRTLKSIHSRNHGTAHSQRALLAFKDLTETFICLEESTKEQSILERHFRFV